MRSIEAPVIDRAVPADDRVPLVSVAIFAHDHERFVGQAVESIAQQTLADLEIVIVDDASTDRTWEIIESYRRVPQVTRTLRHERNLGAPRTYRDGISVARGRYLVPLDADDFAIDRFALERQLEIFAGHPSVAFVHAAYDFVDADGRRLRSFVLRDPRVMPSRAAFERLLLGNVVHHSGTMYGREASEAVGGYSVDLMSAVDWDLWLRLAARGDVGYLSRPLYAYRLHSGNLHLRWLRVAETQMQENLDVVDRAIAFRGDGGALRAKARCVAFLVAARGLFVGAQRSFGLRCLWNAVRSDPRTAASRPELYGALARLAMTSMLGNRGYSLLRRARSLLAGRRARSVAP